MITDAFSSPHRKKFSSSGVSVAQIGALVLIVHGLCVGISVEGRKWVTGSSMHVGCTCDTCDLSKSQRQIKAVKLTKANEGDLQGNGCVNHRDHFCQHPERPWDKGKSWKRELNAILPKVSRPWKWCLLFCLVSKGPWPPVPITLSSLLSLIIYVRTSISPYNCSQTLRTSRKFRGMAVNSNPVHPEHSYCPAAFPHTILTCKCSCKCTCYSHPPGSKLKRVQRATKEKQNLYQSLAWVLMPNTWNTGNSTWGCAEVIAPAFLSIRNSQPIWFVVRHVLNTADISSKQCDYRQLCFKQGKLNKSLSDLERNYQSWSEEICFTT